MQQLSAKAVEEREPALSPSIKRLILLPYAYQTADFLAVVSGLARRFVERGGWQSVFARLGHRLTILPAGCCGMAGT